MISDRGRQRLLLADECFHGLPGDVNGQQDERDRDHIERSFLRCALFASRRVWPGLAQPPQQTNCADHLDRRVSTKPDQSDTACDTTGAASDSPNHAGRRRALPGARQWTSRWRDPAGRSRVAAAQRSQVSDACPEYLGRECRCHLRRSGRVAVEPGNIGHSDPEAMVRPAGLEPRRRSSVAPSWSYAYSGKAAGGRRRTCRCG